MSRGQWTWTAMIAVSIVLFWGAVLAFELGAWASGTPTISDYMVRLPRWASNLIIIFYVGLGSYLIGHWWSWTWTP